MHTKKIIYNLHTFLLFLIFCGTTTYIRAAENITKNGEVPRDSVMKNKLFYFFEVINSETKVKKGVERNKLLKEIFIAQINRTVQSQRYCKSGKCYSASICLSDKEIAVAGVELQKILKNTKTKSRIVGKLKESGYYNLFHDLNDTAFIRKVWEYNAEGINRIFHVYLGGNPPKRYAAIDSISYRQDDLNFIKKVDSAFTAVIALPKNKSQGPFYELFLKLALTVLEINGRDEAARYEPLTEGYNARSFMDVKSIDWDSYRYSMLLVPGFGPEKENVRLHEKGIARCQMAAERFKRGWAPFIMVSGGHVYPFRTPFSEAVEMRRYLIEELNIPENAIIIEPHARHTTTNIRNASRLLYRFGMPDTKKGLVVTDAAQTKMIESLDARCMRELGYVPYIDVKVLNENEVEFSPSPQVFQINLEDILDP